MIIPYLQEQMICDYTISPGADYVIIPYLQEQMICDYTISPGADDL